MYFYEDESIKLFDLVNDIGESKDLSKTQPEIADRLLKELKAWTTAVNAPTPTALNPEFNPKSKTKTKTKKSKSKSKSKPASGNQSEVPADKIHKQSLLFNAEHIQISNHPIALSKSGEIGYWNQIP